MVEVKADALEQSFEAFEDDGVAALKVELETLKAKIASGAIASVELPIALRPITLPPWAPGYDVVVACGERSAEVTLPAKPVPPAIADPSGGATTDDEARAAIAQMLSALRGQGLIAT